MQLMQPHDFSLVRELVHENLRSLHESFYISCAASTVHVPGPGSWITLEALFARNLEQGSVRCTMRCTQESLDGSEKTLESGSLAKRRSVLTGRHSGLPLEDHAHVFDMFVTRAVS